MDIAFKELLNLFGNPSQWSTGLSQKPLPGSNRPHVFYLDGVQGLKAILVMLESARIRNVAIIGINPTALSAGLALKQRDFKVTLLSSGLETTFVQTALQTDNVIRSLKRHGILYYPYFATSLRGSQVHCQSGYCGFICEGRFIKESEEVGCVVTVNGNVYVDAVIIAET